MSEFKPFHLAFPIRDIDETRAFYGDLLGCDIGRSTDKWIDFNFFGHQLSAHIKPEELANAKTNEVDGKKMYLSGILELFWAGKNGMRSLTNSKPME